MQLLLTSSPAPDQVKAAPPTLPLAKQVRSFLCRLVIGALNFAHESRCLSEHLLTAGPGEYNQPTHPAPVRRHFMPGPPHLAVQTLPPDPPRLKSPAPPLQSGDPIAGESNYLFVPP